MLTFKTEEERNEAYDAVPEDAPLGMNIEKFQNEQLAKLEEIEKATIDPEYVPEESNEESNPIVTEPVVAPDKKPVEAPKLDDDEMSRLQRHNEYLQQQRDSVERDSRQRIDSLQTEINKLKSGVTTPKATENVVTPTETEQNIISVRNEIQNLEQEMNEDVDDFDEMAEIKKMKRQAKLHSKLMALQSKRSDDLLKANKAELDALKNEQLLKAQNQEAENKKRTKYENIEKFRSEIKDFQGEKSYEQMDSEYSDFATEVASAYFNRGKNEILAKDTEVAMQKYLEGFPILDEALRTRGIVEPPDMRKFVLMSEVDALKQGYVLDKLTGEWVQLNDSAGNQVKFPNHRAAYLYLQNEKGDHTRDILKAQEQTAKGIMHAASRRADPIELENDHKKGNLDEMTKELAATVLNGISETEVVLRARKNFKDPSVVQYNQALEKLGHATLSPEDL